MKKLVSLLTSITLCTAGLAALYTNASSRYGIGSSYYTEFTAYNDYFSMSPYTRIYISNVPNERGYYSYCLYGGSTSQTGYDAVFSSVYLYYNTYSLLTADEAEVLNNYLTENYPEMSLRSSGEVDSVSNRCDYIIDYNTDLTLEKQLALGIEIHENTGLYFTQYFLDDLFYMARLGDLDGDSAVNALDASLVLTYYSDSQTGNTEIYSDEEIADISLLGDYDGDGAVNALDASLVLKEYAETQTA